MLVNDNDTALYGIKLLPEAEARKVPTTVIVIAADFRNKLPDLGSR